MQFVVEQPLQLQPRPSAIATYWLDRKASIYHAREPRSYMILTGGISCTPFRLFLFSLSSESTGMLPLCSPYPCTVDAFMDALPLCCAKNGRITIFYYGNMIFTHHI